MDTYMCSRCKKNIKKCDKTNHELYCAYLPKTEEMKDLIPCEYCNCLIHFDQYSNHIYRCGPVVVRPLMVRRDTPRPTYSNNDSLLQLIGSHLGMTEQSTSTLESQDISTSQNDSQNTSNITESITEIIQPTEHSIINPIQQDTEEHTPTINSTTTPRRPLLDGTNGHILENTITSLLDSMQQENISNLVNIVSSIPQAAQTEFIDDVETTHSDTSTTEPPYSPPPPPPINNTFQDSSDSSQTNSPEYNLPSVHTFIQGTLNNVINNITTSHIENYEGNPNNNTQTYMNPLFFNNNLATNNYENLMNLRETIGIIERGVQDIDNIAPIKHLDEEINCPICTDKVTIIRRTLCHHQYCPNCLEEWFKTNRTCPICMREFEADSDSDTIDNTIDNTIDEENSPGEIPLEQTDSISLDPGIQESGVQGLLNIESMFLIPEIQEHQESEHQESEYPEPMDTEPDMLSEDIYADE